MSINQNENEFIDEDSLSTGFQTMDEELYGFKKGTLIVLKANPQVPYESFLYEMCEERFTHYVTTVKPENDIKREMKQYNHGNEPDYYPYIHDEFSTSENEDFSSVIGSITNLMTNISEPGKQREKMVTNKFYPEDEDAEFNQNIIVDTFNHNYRTNNPTDAVRNLKEALQRNDSIGVIVINSTNDEYSEYENILLKLSDIIFNIEFVEEGDEIEYQLKMPKSTYKEPIEDVLGLRLDSNGFAIDDSQTHGGTA